MWSKFAKVLTSAWVFFMVLTFGTWAWAQSVPGSDPGSDVNVAEQVSVLLLTAKTGQWSLFAGALIMLVLWVANKAGLKDRFGAAAIPWIAVGLGVLSSVGVALGSGMDWVQALIGGLIAGLSSVGLWEAVFKRFLKA